MISNKKLLNYFRMGTSKVEGKHYFKDVLFHIDRVFLDEDGYPYDRAELDIREWNRRFNKNGIQYRIEGLSYAECGSTLK